MCVNADLHAIMQFYQLIRTSTAFSEIYKSVPKVYR